MRFIHLFFLCCFLASGPAHASTRADLAKVNSDLKNQQALDKQLAIKQADNEEKLQKLQKQLVTASRDVRSREHALLEIQEKRDQTKTQMKAAQANLDVQRASLAQLVLALQRLDRMPPQALLLRPEAPIDTARSFYLLQHVMPVLSKRAGEIKVALDDMLRLQTVLEDQGKKLAAENEKLAARQKVLQQNLDERQVLLKETEKDRRRAGEKISALGRQAKDLQDLLDRLSKIEERPAPPMQKTINALGQSLRSWLGGKTPLPVEGRIATGYGQGLPGGGQSRGISIAAAPGAVVTSPGDGIVRFAGPFRQYKLLIIIQHKNGDHSLLGGLQEIYTATGEKVVSGEPVGKLPLMKIKGDSPQQASLYYERRRNGKPIDPRQARG